MKKDPIKIAFLDIDGVLNVIPQGRDEFGAIFHPHLVENLRHLIEETGAKIVISSTWRASGLTIMKEMWEKRNLPGEVIDITKRIYREGDFYEVLERGHEIQEWMDRNEVDNYVIIDDDNDMLPSHQENFVMTSGNSDHEDCIDIGYGLTKECTEWAIKILNS
jgi:hypothetical protein